MKIRTPEKTEIVKELCLKFPKSASHQLARILLKNYPQLFTNHDSARCCVRYQRGNQGNKHRKLATAPRPNQEAGFVWQFPKSSAPSYEPFILQAERTLIISDLHIPFHDPPAIHAVIDAAAKRNPDCILLNGDICDFFSISRFDKNPTESSLKNEIDLTRQFLGWLRQKFHKARIIWKFGNHDEWFDKYIWRKAPELFGVSGVSVQHLTTAQIGTINEVPGIEFIDDQQKIMAGKLNIWHGHEIGKGSIAPPVNPARGLFMRTVECGIMGHLHKDSMHTETTANGKLIACWSTGCLCGLWPRYARVNKWTHSAAFMTLKNSMFNIEQWRVLNGKIL